MEQYETIEAIEERKAQIQIEITSADDARLDELSNEVTELENRKREILTAIEERKNAEAEVLGTDGKPIMTEERKTMTNMEIRNTVEYVNAYAEYLKGNIKENEVRALLTENVSGQLPVPEFLEEGIKTAWESDPIMSRVKRTFVRGNLKVAFELSATDASVHTEGAAAPTEEVITIGQVDLTPETIKKWITVSTEAMAMGGESFLRYIYDEITYRIVKKAVEEGLDDIVSAPTASTSALIGVPEVNEAPSVTAIPTAAAYLSENARNVAVIMNRLTEVSFLSAQASGNFSIDPFAGLPRLYTSALPAYSAASSGDTYAIVGDLNGLQFNFPEGYDVKTIFDEYSLAESDLVKVVGRQYAGHGVTELGCFVKLTK